MSFATLQTPPRVAHRHLRKVSQFCEEYPAFTPGGVRWLLFQRQQNGLEHAVVRIGRRLLIDVEKFFEWIDTKQAERKEA